MSVLKIVQLIDAVAPPNNGISTSSAINLETGYLRITSSNTNSYVAVIDGSQVGVSSISSFLISQNTSEILKERIARQRISGITTGSTTTITFAENAGNPFQVNDHVSIINAQPAGINTNFNKVVSVTDSSVTILHDSSSVVGVITTDNAVLSRSIKIAVFGEGNNSRVHIAEVQVAGG